jgi:hypothetical protein
MTNSVTVTESNNSVTVTEQNNTVQILEDAPPPTAEPWYSGLTTVPTSSGSATVTADSTSHTKGAWTEIIASNAATTTALLVRVGDIGDNSTDTATLIDIGTGDSGSETAIAANVAVGGANDYLTFVLPVAITSGTRIAIRSQAIIASDTASVFLDTFAFGDVTTVPTTVDVLGTDTATSTGAAIGESYTEVVASTSQDYTAICAVPSISIATMSSAEISLDVATGSAGNETQIVEIPTKYLSSERVLSDQWISYVTAATIPAGTRLSAKTTGLNRVNEVTLIGVPAL